MKLRTIVVAAAMLVASGAGAAVATVNAAATPTLPAAAEPPACRPPAGTFTARDRACTDSFS